MGTGEKATWQSGDQILWTYENPDHPGLLDQRPVTVIADDERHLAVWLAPGTRMLHQVLADGAEIRTADGPSRFSAPRAQAVRTWQGSGIVAVFQPDTPFSVWFFESGSGSRDSYYVNIEAPIERSAWAITSQDRVLDIVVSAEGSFRFKDEDELELAAKAGLFSQSDIEWIWRAADDAVKAVATWSFPFGAGYEQFVPDPDWPTPSLPSDADWDFET